MDVRLPDGTVVQNVPEGTTQEQLSAKLGSQSEKPKSMMENVLSAVKAFAPSLVPGGAGAYMMGKLGDASYEAGGRVTDLTGSPAAGYAANVALNALPMAAGGEAAKVVSEPIRNLARSLMQSALKPTKRQLESGEAETAISTLLKEGINPTKGGVETLKEKVSETSRKLADALKSSDATVKVGDVGKPLLDTLSGAQKQVNPVSDIASVKNAWNEFRNLHPQVAGREEIPVQLAQQLKTGTYKQLSDKYGEMGSSSVEAQKALARGLKDEISKAVPGVSELNARQSDLLQTLNVAERRSLMELNKNPMSLALLAHNPAGFAAFMADKSALFKSTVARMLNAGAEQIPATSARTGIAGAEGIQQLQEH